MIPYLQINSLCISCDDCFLICPEGAILKNAREYVVAPSACTLCYACVEICPVDCIKLISDQSQKNKS